jgi:putative spermidine/putrescine transport system ATP-binding protein
VSAIQIRSLSKHFGSVVALDDVTVEVAEGEFLTVLGPSGSGKTTMLLAVAGFELPTAGTLLMDGRDVTRVPAHKRRVGLTFQSYALFPHMSVEDNVGFPLRVRGVGRKERRAAVAEALRLVRLDGYEPRRPHQLSGGQQQRVALARAFVFEPDILLLDEPLAALDRQLRQTVQVELGELQRSLGVTTVAVTHDQEEALTMSDRILVLENGRVQQHGRPDEVYRCPVNRFVANFLGTANLFDGVVRRREGRSFLRWDGTALELPIPEAEEGTRVAAMLRPEMLRLGAPEGEGLAGRVRTTVYLGATTRYLVEVAPDRILEVTEPGMKRFEAGAATRVTWSLDDVWILPPGGGAPPPAMSEEEGSVTEPVANGATI